MNEEKRKFERRQLSDFTMGLLDFERYDKILLAIDVANERIYAGDYASLSSLYGNLENLYAEWSSIMIPSVKKGIRDKLDQLAISMTNITFTDAESNAIEFIKQQEFQNAMKLAREIREKLMEERQLAGFGIKTTFHESDRKIFKRAISI